MKQKIRHIIHTLCNPRWDVYWFVLFFVLLTASGITGSSLGWIKSYPGMSGVVQLEGERKIAGIYRGVRGDEFLAHAIPSALMQYQTDGAFPKINTKVGLSGRNMLVLHDTGAAVYHPAILARPAVWGFFLLDLRRSLAWYWWMPIFLGIGGIWFFLNTLYPEHSRRNLMLAVLGGFCPYAAGWSFWPLYNASGVFLGGGAVVRALDAKRFSWAWGLLAGWGCAVSALTIYMPRIWSCSTLVLFLLIAEVYRRRENRPWMQGKNYVAAAAAMAVMLGLLLSFWWSCREEIALIAQSVYPGRRFDCGGSMGFWDAVKGWFVPITIYKTNSGNQSEMQAAQLFWIPLTIGAVWFRHKIRWDARIIAPGLFLIFVIWYQYIGFPEWFAALTFWRYCTPGRAEMALGLGQIFVLAALLDQKVSGCGNWKYAVGAGACGSVLAGILICLIPQEIVDGFAAVIPYWMLIGITAAILLWHWVISAALFRSVKYFVILLAFFSLLPALVFNPICIAPRAVTSPLADRLPQTGKHNGRICFVTSTNYLAIGGEITGLPCFNGYFMYEDPAIWQQFFSSLPDAENFHRMNHLDACISTGDAPEFDANVPFNDRIRISFHGEKYDFRRLPVDYVAISSDWREAVKNNSSLQWKFASAGVDYYSVVR